MSSQKSLLKSMSVRESGKQHQCRSNKKHLLPKGEIMLVIKEGQDERHYCRDCSVKFVATAYAKLDGLIEQLGVVVEDDLALSSAAV